VLLGGTQASDGVDSSTVRRVAFSNAFKKEHGISTSEYRTRETRSAS
jgi:hypothetical protein